jgi:hypothetical protein
MAGLEVLTGNDRLSILQCEELAKEIGFDKMSFDLVGPKGKLKCKWLDAYFGMFKIIEPGKESDRFMMSRDLMYAPGIYCENAMIEED